MTTRRHVRRLLMFGLCFGALTLGMGRTANAQPITVTNTGDSGPGSLRQAIADAAPGDTIEFDIGACPCSIALGSGPLTIGKNLTIKGPAGVARLGVDAQGQSQIFEVATGATVQLENLQLEGGSNLGAILNRGALTLFNLVITANHAIEDGSAITSYGTVTLRSSRVVGNTNSGGSAIAILGGALAVVNSTIADNSGPAVVTETGTGATIVGSTISGNGGAAIQGRNSNVHVVNSTISGNAGPGIDVFKGAMTVLSTTVINNTGGGVRTSGAAPEKHKSINNSIVGGNGIYDIAGEFDVQNNNLTGPVTGVLNETLVDNGGPTLTHALLSGSPAIGAGGNGWIPNDAVDLDGDGDASELLPVDQRGVGFARVAGSTVDIGAVEATCSAITISPATLPNPSVGVAYSQQLTASGGQGLVTFAATGLPPGLTLSSDGVLGGTATASGTFTVTVTATDGEGCGGTHTYTLTVADTTCGIVIGPPTLKTPYLATLYYQPVSVTPSGKYTVTVAAGALPQGVYLFAIGHNWFLGGIPTKPGEYTLTLAAKKKNSPCAPTRTYTVIVPATVLPQLTCVAKTGGKQYTARFGYDNSTDAAVTIPVGADNYFTPGAQDRGQVTTFQKGRVTNAFSVVFTVKNNHTDLALWYLRGPDNVRRPVNITTATSRCP